MSFQIIEIKDSKIIFFPCSQLVFKYNEEFVENTKKIMNTLEKI